ncbi:hypothetical protein BH10ACT1_BH10ACT1_33160 [soil metagenome]
MSLRRTVQLVVALAIASLAFASAGSAGAVDNPDYTAPPPTSVVSNSTPRPVRQVASVAATPSRQQLAITGSDVLQLVVVGAVLVAGGTATLVLRRRSAAA